MILPPQAVIEFKEIYQRKIGKTLTHDKASIKAENLLKLMILITERSRKLDINIGLTKNEK